VTKGCTQELEIWGISKKPEVGFHSLRRIELSRMEPELENWKQSGCRWKVNNSFKEVWIYKSCLGKTLKRTLDTTFYIFQIDVTLKSKSAIREFNKFTWYPFRKLKVFHRAVKQVWYLSIHGWIARQSKHIYFVHFKHLKKNALWKNFQLVWITKELFTLWCVNIFFG